MLCWLKEGDVNRLRTLDSGWRVLSAPQDEAYSVVFDMPVNANSCEVRIAVPSDAPASVAWDTQGVCAVEP